MRANPGLLGAHFSENGATPAWDTWLGFVARANAADRTIANAEHQTRQETTRLFLARATHAPRHPSGTTRAPLLKHRHLVPVFHLRCFVSLSVLKAPQRHNENVVRPPICELANPRKHHQEGRLARSRRIDFLVQLDKVGCPVFDERIPAELDLD